MHRAINAPWWFASLPATDPHRTSRFDLPHPKGTCYLAEHDVGAFLESLQEHIGTGAPVPWPEVAARAISSLSVPRPMRLADCRSRRSVNAGLSAGIHSTSDRSLTQGWADAFQQAGFDGIVYLLQHDLAQQEVGYALFHDAGLASWPVNSTGPIMAGLIADMQNNFSIIVR